MKLMCCESECGKGADFAIFEGRTDIPPDSGETHACEAHVGGLLGTPIDRETETTEWRVFPIEMCQ